jgi:hypothetical protein
MVKTVYECVISIFENKVEIKKGKDRMCLK